MPDFPSIIILNGNTIAITTHVYYVPSMTEQEAAQQSVQQRQTSPALMWPSIGGMPLNEFTTEGYFTCAFPTLFPTGAGDFLGQRQVPVTIGHYFKHLMQ